MDYTISVDPSVLLSASDDIQYKTSTIERTFSELQSKVQETSSFWMGEAAELHRRLFLDQVSAMETVIRQFKEQSENLKKISGNYGGAQAAAESAVEELPDNVIV